jgi:hypothetical protein
MNRGCVRIFKYQEQTDNYRDERAHFFKYVMLKTQEKVSKTGKLRKIGGRQGWSNSAWIEDVSTSNENVFGSLAVSNC